MSTAMARSISPGPAANQHQTKREKRRTQIADKLQSLRDSFDSLQVDHYYAQLMALQCDVNLILRADPYRNGPLSDSTDDVSKQVAEAREEITRNGKIIAADAESSFGNIAGRTYTRFVEDVNAALEGRDTDMTVLLTQFDKDKYELQRSHAYKVQLAHEEHRLLSRTIRDRLLQANAQKKARLLKDKEQLDIADSNSLLLNPAQYGLGNPSSPGGLQNPRKTRNTRGRPGEGDEPAALTTAENKRKRKAMHDERDEGSPAPPSRTAIETTPAPWADAKAKAIYAQHEAPLYSVDRLFTEKELLLNMNRSHVATAEYFERLRVQGIDSRLPAATAAAAAAAASASNGATLKDAADDSAHDSADPPADDSAAPAPSYHATRSTGRAPAPSSNPLDSLASVADASSRHQLANLISSVSAAASKHNVAAPALPAAADADAKADLEIMRAGPADPRYERIVAACTERLPLGASWSDSARAAADGAADPDFGAYGPAAVAAMAAPSGAGGVAMGKSASSMGFAGVSMARGASLAGSEPMRRTASARGLPS